MTESSLKARLWSRETWRSRATCSLEISMDNKRQEGSYLASQITWINRHFKRCVIHMGDTLHRHNLMDRMSPEEAHAASYVMGSAWLARNAEIIESLEIPCEIIRWDQWLTHPDFPDLHAAMRAYHESNAFFRGIVARDAAGFIARNPSANPVRCVDYLLEEAAADTLFCRERPVARLYPASELATYAHLSRTEIPDHLKGLDRGVHVRVSFHRRKGSAQGGKTPTPTALPACEDTSRKMS